MLQVQKRRACKTLYPAPPMYKTFQSATHSTNKAGFYTSLLCLLHITITLLQSELKIKLVTLHNISSVKAGSARSDLRLWLHGLA